MIRRGSEYFRGRSSVAIVNETRGVPFQVVSLLLAVGFGIVAIRCFFFCAYGLTESDRIHMQDLFPSCDTDKSQQLSADLAGLTALAQTLIHFHVATTTHVADLYITMKAALVMDFGFVLVVLRFGLQKSPVIYPILIGGGFLYECFVFTIAQKAYVARQKMKRGQDKK